MDIPIRAYRQKLIKSGDLIEIYDYEEAVKIGHKRKKRKQKIIKPEPPQENKESAEPTKEDNEFFKLGQEIKSNFSLRRTKSNIVRLINSNSDLKVFITLTFDSNKSDSGSFTNITKCNLIFTNFIKRLKRYYQSLRYLAVPEFQSDYFYHSKIRKEHGGNIHYHMLSNISFIASDKLEKIWRYGFIKINNIRHVSRVGLYVAKYIGKELFDGRLHGKKKIFYSRQLNKPEIIISGLKVRLYFNNLKSPPELLLDKQYRSDYVGRVRYRLFKTI